MPPTKKRKRKAQQSFYLSPSPYIHIVYCQIFGWSDGEKLNLNQMIKGPSMAKLNELLQAICFKTTKLDLIREHQAECFATFFHWFEILLFFRETRGYLLAFLKMKIYSTRYLHIRLFLGWGFNTDLFFLKWLCRGYKIGITNIFLFRLWTPNKEHEVKEMNSRIRNSQTTKQNKRMRKGVSEEKKKYPEKSKKEIKIKKHK